MKRTTKLFILIGVVALALGIGTGLLIKYVRGDYEEIPSVNVIEAPDSPALPQHSIEQPEEPLQEQERAPL